MKYNMVYDEYLSWQVNQIHFMMQKLLSVNSTEVLNKVKWLKLVIDIFIITIRIKFSCYQSKTNTI